MKPIQNILYATDFSGNAQNALPYAVDLVKKTEGKFSLLNVYDVPLVIPEEVKDNIVTIRENTRTKSMNRLKQIIFDEGLEDLPHRCFVREGSIKDEILNIIEKNDIQLVVMGTKGETADQGIFMGSIATAVTRNALCPVLAVPETARFNGINKIVYLTDLQYDETELVNYLVAFAALYQAIIVVLHVSTDRINKSWNQEALKEVAGQSSYPNITFEELVADDVENGILQYLEDQKADLLAMTTYTTTLFDKLFHKSLTKQLLKHSHTPLLAFNRKKHNTVFI